MAKYSEEQSKSEVRPELLELAMAVVKANNDSGKSENSAKFLDVTGSLGCWGVVHEQ